MSRAEEFLKKKNSFDKYLIHEIHRCELNSLWSSSSGAHQVASSHSRIRASFAKMMMTWNDIKLSDRIW